METAALRTWGLVASASAFSVALTIAALGGCGQSERASEPPVAGAPSQAEPTIATPADEAQPVAEAAAEVAPPPVRLTSPVSRPSFVVRFTAPHPLARAQDIAAAGRVAEARRAAVAALNGQRNLRGLCFDRFTLGGAETVLAACSGVSDARTFQARWTERLNAMSGVDYAEANAVAQPEMRSAP